MSSPEESTTPTAGRRERKKARTRQLISDAALRLFVDRGFDSVTVAEVADQADVAVSTLFVHFPTKESLLFPREGELGAGFAAAVADRAPGVGVLAALRAYVHAAPTMSAGTCEYVELVQGTPALAEHVDAIWRRHGDALAEAIGRATGAPDGDTLTRAIARYVVEIPSIVRAAPDRDAAIDAVFDLLQNGWRDPERG